MTFSHSSPEQRILESAVNQEWSPGLNVFSVCQVFAVLHVTSNQGKKTKTVMMLCCLFCLLLCFWLIAAIVCTLLCQRTVNLLDRPPPLIGNLPQTSDEVSVRSKDLHQHLLQRCLHDSLLRQAVLADEPMNQLYSVSQCDSSSHICRSDTTKMDSSSLGWFETFVIGQQLRW